MASKLKLEELRSELAKRGLSTSGTKPSLVRRLESALEREKGKADGGEVGNRKRGRESEGDGDYNPEKIKAIDEYRDMNLKQLRETAKLRGVSSAGTKKELLHRLCQTNGNDTALPDKQEEEEEIKEEEKIVTATKKEKEEEEEEIKEEEIIVTATKKGSAVLDQCLPDHVKSNYHVLQLGDDVYDAMLNQTNVGNNNNKFYVIQLLESDDGGKFMVYNRWGRVGVKGQDKLFGPYTSRNDAIQEFEQKFYAKTKNHWSNRKDFVCFPKTYTWLEMDYSEKEDLTVDKEKAITQIAAQPRETCLEPRVAKFISLICNVSMMKQQMMEIGYNANKLPLGKLSKSTILKGYDVLKRIADVISTGNRTKIEELSGEFYTVIPHDFGFKKMRNFIIDSPQKLKSKLEMVEALAEIEVATKLLGEEPGVEDDPLYSSYNRLRCELTPLEHDSDEFSMIANYVQNTHAKTHSQYTVDIIHIFRTSREGEAERFKKFSSTKNRMLLWHGSRLTNWTGILSQGLRIAPPEAPVTGYMFGKGVYFADMFSKSANYCYASHSAPAGVLLLCEVALGDMQELFYAKYDADQLPPGKLSTKGVGKTAPDLSDAKSNSDGVIVPIGKPKEQQNHEFHGALLYNEYIVYDVDQVRMCYVVQVDFKFH